MIKKIKKNELCLYDKIILNNEEQTKDCLDFCREEYDFEKEKVYYISDIHIDDKITGRYRKLKYKDFIENVVSKMLSGFKAMDKPIILIGGDVTHNIDIFKIFVEKLRNKIDEKYIYAKIIFVLGNHELWGFKKVKLDEIVIKYKKMLADNNMYLLQNELIYFDKKYNKKHHIFGNELIKLPYNELNKMQIKQVEIELSNAEIVVFGGIGFSGYNDELNAEKGDIYRKVLNRKQEVEETKKFECLYNKLHSILIKKNTIILTHMPKSDWSSEKEYDDNLIYVNGHTHRNDYFISDDKQIYSDNQIGYKNKKVKLKYFYMDNSYDIFDNLGDCIKTITCDEYNEFLKGKNIGGGLSAADIIWMLKKNGYYLFIHESASGSKTILNGGQKKKISNHKIDYYYAYMDYSILKLKEPYEKYYKIQKQIAKHIIKFGGNGSIHGAIIDIDFMNHIFINPIDNKITFYWAHDIVNKIIYPDIFSLLLNKNKILYNQLLMYINENNVDSSIILSKDSTIVSNGIEEKDTKIYRYSKLLCKMQKLNKKVLTMWVDVNNIKGLQSLKE